MEIVPSSSPADRSSYQYTQPQWSGAEKKIARKLFDSALQRELDEVVQEVKRRAAGIDAPAGLWELEDYLTERRKEIDRKYDYRYSQLPILFAHLIRERRISQDDLAGLAADKLTFVRALSSFPPRRKNRA
jgi:hypothetical protein